MCEDVAHRAEGRWMRFRRLVCPVAPRECGHSAEQSARRPADEPDVPIALNPVGQPIPVMPRRTRLQDRVTFRITARMSSTMVAERTDATLRGLRTADGRAEIHHRLREVAGASVGNHPEGQPLDLLLCGLPHGMQPAYDSMDVPVDRRSLFVERDRGD